MIIHKHSEVEEGYYTTSLAPITTIDIIVINILDYHVASIQLCLVIRDHFSL